jgi:hypothetical protein
VAGIPAIFYLCLFGIISVVNLHRNIPNYKPNFFPFCTYAGMLAQNPGTAKQNRSKQHPHFFGLKTTFIALDHKSLIP